MYPHCKLRKLPHTDAVASLTYQGYSGVEIARKLNVSAALVSNLQKRIGLRTSQMPMQWRILRRCTHCKATDCYIWQGTLTNDMGRIYVNGKWKSVAREMYKAVNGELADTVQVRHKCSNRLCVNVNHLHTVDCTSY
jgi:hypothetical protein